MVIITNISYPPERAKEIANRFLEAPQIPNYMQRKGPYINSSLEDGVHTISVFELDKTYLAEGLEFLGNYYVSFFGVPDFKYQIRPYFDVEEGLKMIGIE